MWRARITHVPKGHVTKKKKKFFVVLIDEKTRLNLSNVKLYLF